MPDHPQQGELLLEAPPLPEDAPFLPARMVNEYVYCPRLAYLEWVQGEWAESADTVEGTHAHRRVDREDRPLPAADVLGESERPRTRAVTLSSRRLGLVAKDRPGRERRRERRARRLQARQATARCRRRLRPGARAALRPGAAARGERLPLHRRRALLRREPRAGARRLRRGAARGDAGGDRRAAPGRRRWPHPAAAARQSQVPALLARRHLPAR